MTGELRNLLRKTDSRCFSQFWKGGKDTWIRAVDRTQRMVFVSYSFLPRRCHLHPCAWCTTPGTVQESPVLSIEGPISSRAPAPQKSVQWLQSGQ